MKVRNKQGLTEEEFLARYDAGKYERPSVTVDMLIFAVNEGYGDLSSGAKLLMIKRGDHPCIGQWALPGGFVNMNESLAEAAARELKEETGLENVYLEQLYTFGDLGRDPRTRIISVAYLAVVDASVVNPQAGDDAADAQWFAVKSETLREEKRQASRLVRLTFSGSGLSGVPNELSGEIMVTAMPVGRMQHVSYRLLSSHGIAFDHVKIVQLGLERLATILNGNCLH
ncbi:MAG TPA: NUDIX hydrolase [Desulfobacteria bacterium]|nr:NUDIX hydrolase [Desulfobacteria bacterium]